MADFLASEFAPQIAALLVGLLIIIPMLASAFIPSWDEMPLWFRFSTGLFFLGLSFVALWFLVLPHFLVVMGLATVGLVTTCTTILDWILKRPDVFQFDEEGNPMPYKVIPASVYFADLQGDPVFVRTASIKSVELQEDRAVVDGGDETVHFVPRSVGLYLVQLLFPEAYADYEDARPLPEGFEPPPDEEDTAPATLKAVQS
ncbi:MAG: hypothetical protein ACOYL5_09635 [Phototrophicaceae bacterium]